MLMNAADQRVFPRLTTYVRTDLPKVMAVPAIVRAMRTVAQLRQVALRRALTWGKNPMIVTAPLAGAYGEFTPGIRSNEIRIDTAVAAEFEAGRGRRVARAGNAYLVGVTILHELVHWGDDQDGVDRGGEEGEEFERLVYGGVL